MQATLEASTVKVYKRDPTDTHLYGEEIPAENIRKAQVNCLTYFHQPASQ